MKERESQLLKEVLEGCVLEIISKGYPMAMN